VRGGRAGAVALALVLVLAAACSGGKPRTVETEALPPPFTYVAVGASETVGVGAGDPATESWPSVFHRTALARSATLVNVGAREATVRVALDRELQPALAEQPRLAAVWLNVNDLVRQVPVEQYEADLTTVVRALRRGGAADLSPTLVIAKALQKPRLAQSTLAPIDVHVSPVITADVPQSCFASSRQRGC